MNKSKKVIIVFGTRPEAIKMAPIIKAFLRDGNINPVVCVTGQHKEMLYQVLDFFQITPDYDLELMTANQSLCGLTARAVKGVEEVMHREKPDMVLVQGDTTTAFTGAYVGFLNKVPVGHVEAGLRTGNKAEPFPEEVNRRLIGQVADLHFCPTDVAAGNLIAEQTTDAVHVLGNTVIDALLAGTALLGDSWKPSPTELGAMATAEKSVLITLHRRETFGGELDELLNALDRLATDHPETEFIFPVHPNPNVRNPVIERLSGLENLKIIDPLDYPNFIWAMSKATLILTDSGGVQEEAPSLGVPVLVARKVTERQEGVDAGVAELVGTDEEVVYAAANKLLAYPSKHQIPNPYGDGHASERIVATCIEFLNTSK